MVGIGSSVCGVVGIRRGRLDCWVSCICWLRMERGCLSCWAGRATPIVTGVVCAWLGNGSGALLVCLVDDEVDWL